MKTLIWSYWHADPVLPGAEYAAAQMAQYARMVGADYRFDRFEKWTNRYEVPARWYDKLRPVFDPSFAPYDRVLVCDLDVFPVDGITDNIFDQACGDFAMAEEPDQPSFRAMNTANICTKNDLLWADFVTRYGAKIPVDQQRRPRTWNAGVILFSREGMDKLRVAQPSMKTYYDATRKRFTEMYSGEQNYLNALAFSGRFDFRQLSPEWNRQIHHIGKEGGDRRALYDKRTRDTKFVHVQMRGADWNDAAWHHRIVNSHLNGTSRHSAIPANTR